MTKDLLLLFQAYKRHLSGKGEDSSTLDATINLISHTSEVIEFFSSSKEVVVSKDDVRIKRLDAFLTFFSHWRGEVASPNGKEFISNKLWFDLQSMTHGFKAIVNIKLSKFPNSSIKPWLVNQDGVENHFCQTRSCNGQNNNPTYRLQESAQNSIRFGQQPISTKCNAGKGR